MWNRKRAALAAAAALLATGCKTVPDVAGQLVPGGWTESGSEGPKIKVAGPTEYVEAEDGARLLDQIEHRGDLQILVLNMPHTENLLNTALSRVARHWPHETPRPAGVKVNMLSQYHGAAYADGTILIGLGTFAPVASSISNAEGAEVPTLSSDEELLYLLAHEYAHYALGHHNKSDHLSGLRNFTAQLTKAYNIAAVLQEVRYQETADGGTIVVQDQNQVAKDMESAINTFDLIGALSARGLSPAWNRSQEDEADVLALDLIKAEGINAPVYEAMFTSMKAHESLTKQLGKSLHASVQQMQAQAMTPASLDAAMTGNMKQVSASILDNAVDAFTRSAREQLVDYFGQTHRPPKTRLNGVQRYELAAYPEVTEESRDMAAFTEEPSTVLIDQIRTLDEFEDARIATIAYYQSIDLRTNRNYAAAELAIQKAMKTRFDTQPAILFESGRVAEFSGNREVAKTRYRAVLDQVPLPDAYRKLARLEIRSGRYAYAESVIAEGEVKLGDTDYFLPSRIALTAARDDIDGAVSLVLQCRETSRSELIAACEASHAGIDPTEMTPEQKAVFERQGQIGTDAGNELVKGLGGLFDRD